MERVECREAFLQEEALRQAAANLPTPFYLYDERGIREHMRSLRQGFSWCGGYRQYFPIHTLPVAGVLKLLREEGSGVSCCTLEELRLAEYCGFRGDEIFYAPMLPQKEAMEAAADLGATVTVDSPEAARALLLGGWLPETVSLMLNPGGRFSVGVQAVARPERSKRGMTERQLQELAPWLRSCGAKRIGLEAALTSQTLLPGYYAAVADLLISAASRLHPASPAGFFHLGGGPGLGAMPGEAHADLLQMGAETAAMAAARGAAAADFFTGADRILTGPHGVLVSRVLCVKRSWRNYVVVDADQIQFPRIRRSAHHRVMLLGKERENDRFCCDVVGYLPHAPGRFCERQLLPVPVPGDLLVIRNAGFFDAADPAQFCCAKCPQYLYTLSGEIRLLEQPALSHGQDSQH